LRGWQVSQPWLFARRRSARCVSGFARLLVRGQIVTVMTADLLGNAGDVVPLRRETI